MFIDGGKQLPCACNRWYVKQQRLRQIILYYRDYTAVQNRLIDALGLCIIGGVFLWTLQCLLFAGVVFTNVFTGSISIESSQFIPQGL